MRKLLITSHLWTLLCVLLALSACATSRPTPSDEFFEVCWDLFAELPVNEIREICEK